MSVLIKSAVNSVVAVPATTDTLLLASNPYRRGVFIQNGTAGLIFVKFGTGASATSNVNGAAGIAASTGTFSASSIGTPVYTGQINVFANSAGNVAVTEW